MSRAVMSLLAGALLACDAQAGDRYNGEPLLSVHGEAQLSPERASYDALQPTVAFRDADQRFHLIRVDARGEFPARFTLDLLEPPPEDTLLPFTTLDGEPPVAIGYITAVTPDTPRVFTFSSRMPPRAEPVLDAAGVQWMCAPDMGGCYRYEMVQLDGREVERLTVCPELDVPLERCRVSYPFEEQMFDDFAGLSENYVVLYLPSAAEPETVLAHHFGRREVGLAAGYHLLEVRPLTNEQLEAVQAGSAAAYAMAVERTNAELGADFASVDEVLEQCAEIDYERGVCTDQAAELVAAYYGLAQLELDCTVHLVDYRYVEDPPSERIEVRIGAELTLL